jgi:hypothetical protein
MWGVARRPSLTDIGCQLLENDFELMRNSKGQIRVKITDTVFFLFTKCFGFRIPENSPSKFENQGQNSNIGAWRLGPLFSVLELHKSVIFVSSPIKGSEKHQEWH